MDPYRWLEEQHSSRTRKWLKEQWQYARTYLDQIPCRNRVRARVQELLSVETCDSLFKVGNRFFFRKREPQQEQPCIYMREGAEGQDQLLVDPGVRGMGNYIAVRILQVSANGKLLAYEVKHGGEASQAVEILDVDRRETLPDGLTRGFLQGFAFAPDSQSYYYVQRALTMGSTHSRVAFQHFIGSDPQDDNQVFCAGNSPKLNLGICSDESRLGFLVVRRNHSLITEFYLRDFDATQPPRLAFRAAGDLFAPILVPGRILALTNRNAPNMCLIELQPFSPESPIWSIFVQEADARLTGLAVARGAERIFLSYLKAFRTCIDIYSLSGKKLHEIRFPEGQTVRILPNSTGSDELIYESESFTDPPAIYRYLPERNQHILWSKREIPSRSGSCISRQISFASKDGTQIPMFLVGRRDVLDTENNPTILTAYGGFGASMTPQFSVLVNFLIERGCLFALANVRGGSEFGEQWHQAGKRRKRQKVYDDFVGAAEWLVGNRRTTTEKLAIFGGSNAGLLVGTALTQRPDLFRAVVCVAPLLDMLRYHLFDSAEHWEDEYGTAENDEDFAALYAYSPYHQVRPGVAYPATLIVSGDADGNCNPLHARKMAARLQAANSSRNPILLDYKELRGHSPVLPLTERIEGLTDRLAFVSDQLKILI